MVLYDTHETIVAVASAPGSSVRGIVRLSGPRVRELVEQFFQINDKGSWSACRPSSHLGTWRLPTPLRPLPCRVFLWPTQRSYTRQPTAEIHTVGSPPLLQAIVSQVTQVGARIARPGEFTLRAFLAGRIDLTQAEAVLGVIDAQDQQQLDRALTQLAGQLTQRLQHLRDDLLNLLADVEAGLDFVDEDIAFITPRQIHGILQSAIDELVNLLQHARAQRTVTDWPRVLLLGRPNAGKSTLANALTQRELAIVSDTPGTTRDYLEVRWDLDGITCHLVDTAGAEIATDAPVNQAAQQMTEQARARADVVVLCVPADRPLDAWESSQVDRFVQGAVDGLVVRTKCDQPRTMSDEQDLEAMETSGVTGAGLTRLRTELRRILAQRAPAMDGAALVSSTATRCLDHLDHCLAALQRAQHLADYPEQQILLATELRAALDELGVILGAIYTEDLLDRVFQRFCIGK